jgi:hypothetical protein
MACPNGELPGWRLSSRQRSEVQACSSFSIGRTRSPGSNHRNEWPETTRSSQWGEVGFDLGLSDACMDAPATYSASRRTRTAHAGNRGGWGRTSPRAYGDSGISVLAMVLLPMPVARWPAVLRGRLLHHMSYAGKLVTGLGKGGGVSVTVRADHASIEGLIRHGRE